MAMRISDSCFTSPRLLATLMVRGPWPQHCGPALLDLAVAPGAAFGGLPIYADYAPDPVQGARWAEAAFAEEEEEDDGDATDDEKEAS